MLLRHDPNTLLVVLSVTALQPNDRVIAHNRISTAIYRRVVVLLVLVAATAGTAAYGNDPAAPSTQPTGTYRITNVTVNGHSVPYITWKDGYVGGLFCDWTAR